MALIHPNPSSPAIIPCPCHPPWPVPGLPVSGRNSEGLGPPGLRSDQARRSLALEKYEGRMGGRKSMYQIASGKLWQTYKKLWKITIYSEFSHEKWWCSIVMCMFTRGYIQIQATVGMEHQQISLDIVVTAAARTRLLRRISQWIVRMPTIQRIA